MGESHNFRATENLVSSIECFHRSVSDVHCLEAAAKATTLPSKPYGLGQYPMANIHLPTVGQQPQPKNLWFENTEILSSDGVMTEASTATRIPSGGKYNFPPLRMTLSNSAYHGRG